MTVFCVFKEGVYRHECGGVYSSLELAKQAAQLLAQDEPDDWQSYEVRPFEVNRQTEQGVKGRGVLEEPQVLYRCRRRKDGTVQEERA